MRRATCSSKISDSKVIYKSRSSPIAEPGIPAAERGTKNNSKPSTLPSRHHDSHFGCSSIEGATSNPQRSANGTNPPARKTEDRGQLNRNSKATTTIGVREAALGRH